MRNLRAGSTEHTDGGGDDEDSGDIIDQVSEWVGWHGARVDPRDWPIIQRIVGFFAEWTMNSLQPPTYPPTHIHTANHHHRRRSGQEGGT